MRKVLCSRYLGPCFCAHHFRACNVVDCTINLDGKKYLDIQTETECSLGTAEYRGIYIRSIVGILFWIVLAVLSGVMLHRGGHVEFKFLSDKLKPRYFWWEMVPLLRRLMIMIIAQSTTSEPL